MVSMYKKVCKVKLISVGIFKIQFYHDLSPFQSLHSGQLGEHVLLK